MSVDTSAGTIVWAAPDWEDVHQWVSLLGASSTWSSPTPTSASSSMPRATGRRPTSWSSSSRSPFAGQTLAEAAPDAYELRNSD